MTKLSVPDQHRLKIARSTLKMNNVGAAIMGGMTKTEARQVIFELTGKRVPVDPDECKHPPERNYSWFAYDGRLCVGCCDCGTPLRGTP